MKIAVLSDIHGNYEAMEAVIQDAMALGVRAWANLGDAIGYGPDPDLVVTRLALLKAVSVRGNHEQSLFRSSLAARSSRDAQVALGHTARKLTPAARLWLSLLPASQSSFSARFVHGMPPSSIMRYCNQCKVEEIRKRFAAFPEDICFVGHTHMREIIRLEPDGGEGEVLSCPLFTGRHQLRPGGRHIVSVGSVGFPRGGEQGAQYLIWNPTNKVVIVRTVPYDAAPVKQKMREMGLPERLAASL